MIKPRFSLKMLLCVVPVLAVLFGYWRVERVAARAEEQYERVWAEWDAGVGTTMGVCAASFGLYEAESKRWFGSGTALDRHLERLEKLAAKIEGLIPTSIFDEPCGRERRLQQVEDIRTLREGCVEWLKRP
jgi:hypothetical protein